jgi:hypothetical protein
MPHRGETYHNAPLPHAPVVPMQKIAVRINNEVVSPTVMVNAFFIVCNNLISTQ